jgi:hypothetical protein
LSTLLTKLDCRQEYTLTSTLLTVERDTTSRPHCCSGKEYTLLFTSCLWRIRIHPYVHTHIDRGKGYNHTTSCPMSTLLAVERDTPSCSHPAGGGKGYTLTSTHTLTVERDTTSRPQCWWWKWIHPHVHNLLVLGSFDRPSLKREARWFFRKI